MIESLEPQHPKIGLPRPHFLEKQPQTKNQDRKRRQPGVRRL